MKKDILSMLPTELESSFLSVELLVFVVFSVTTGVVLTLGPKPDPSVI